MVLNKKLQEDHYYLSAPYDFSHTPGRIYERAAGRHTHTARRTETMSNKVIKVDVHKLLLGHSSLLLITDQLPVVHRSL